MTSNFFSNYLAHQKIFSISNFILKMKTELFFLIILLLLKHTYRNHILFYEVIALPNGRANPFADFSPPCSAIVFIAVIVASRFESCLTSFCFTKTRGISFYSTGFIDVM